MHNIIEDKKKAPFQDLKKEANEFYRDVCFDADGNQCFYFIKYGDGQGGYCTTNKDVAMSIYEDYNGIASLYAPDGKLLKHKYLEGGKTA